MISADGSMWRQWLIVDAVGVMLFDVEAAVRVTGSSSFSQNLDHDVAAIRSTAHIV